ncbi:hypothetical protein PILCRDRAFT_823410 [Piloderma croceum F 1598]|uniref:DUF6534 domain-containing protein n=1 Tax=Piloderma croceum (strain F 1598) TaxID=765440 RepID=A0A0C3F411_PILCF|nr:hypothetical protein PILCRDRAFT_823410 [Piloderma croceum F 1598]
MAPAFAFAQDQNTTWGVVLIGIVLASILFGITWVQTYIYYTSYGGDSRSLKLLVGILWVLDCAHTAVITHTVYFGVITHVGEPETSVVWSKAGEIYLTVCDISSNTDRPFNSLAVRQSSIAWIVQIFLIVRIWHMSRGIVRYATVTILFLISALSFATGFAYASRILEIKVVARVAEAMNLMNVALGSTVAGDILLTICMSFLLSRSRTGIERTDTLVNTLIKYTVRNGLITSACALLVVIMNAALPRTQAFLAFYSLLSKLYANTLLSTLNARNVLRSKSENTNSSSIRSEIFLARSGTRPSYQESSVGVIKEDGQSKPALDIISQPRIEAKAQTEV